MTTTRKTRQPVKALNQSSTEVAAAAAADRARKQASREAAKQAREAAKPAREAAKPVERPATPQVDEQAVQARREQDAANALATAVADAEATGVTLEQMLADMGIDDQGRPLQTDKQRYDGPMLALVAARKSYVKAANGILCNGDQLAVICGAHSRDETVKALGRLLFAKGLTTAVNPYLSLNPGQQSMNLRNKARHALKAGTVTMADVQAAYEYATAAA